MYTVLFCNNEFVNKIKNTLAVDYSLINEPTTSIEPEDTRASQLSSGMDRLFLNSSLEEENRSIAYIPNLSTTRSSSDNDLFHLRRFESMH